jgi:hypothetical protein
MAELCRAIKVEVANKVGRLAELADRLKDAGVNMRAVCAWVQDGRGHMIVVPSDADKACAAVRDHVDKCSFMECVCVQAKDEPGALGQIAHALAKGGVDIEVMYASAGMGGKALIALHTSDNAKAAKLV